MVPRALTASAPRPAVSCSAGSATGSAASAATDTAEGAFDSKISDLMNKISDKYRHLEYDYDEDLLAVLDAYDGHDEAAWAKNRRSEFSKP